MSDATDTTTAAPFKTTASDTFSAEERAAMKERTKELKSAARRSAKAADGKRDVLEKIGEMSGTDRAIAERFHALVTEAAPHLVPKTWYGMPAYAKDGKIVCFFQPAEKFTARYATIGFNDAARLDAGTVWPTSFAVTELTDADEEFFADLVRRAAG